MPRIAALFICKKGIWTYRRSGYILMGKWLGEWCMLLYQEQMIKSDHIDCEWKKVGDLSVPTIKIS